MVANEALLHNWFYGNHDVRVLAAVVFAFLMGSIPLTPIVRWLCEGLDARIGRTAAGLTPGLNAVKALVPVAIAVHGGGQPVGLAAAVAVMLGHAYTPWLRLNGGTGVAVAFGSLLALEPAAGVIFLAVWLVAAVAGNYALVGSLLACAVSIVSLWYFEGAPGACVGVVVFLVVSERSRPQLAALAEDREPTLRPTPRPATARAPLPARASIVVDGQTVQRV
jgi:glycerol-3-phosphate acyltransferase PlsY